MADELTEWIDVDGAAMDLDVEWNTVGRFGPRVAVDEEEVPGSPGSRARGVRHLARDFVLPIWVTAADEVALRTAMRQLVVRMDPKRGAGTIRVTSPGGDQREITCMVVDGLGMLEHLGETSGPTVQRVTLLMRAHDPYWQAAADEGMTIESGDRPSLFPFFPLRLSSSEVFAEITVTNTGDVDAWPVWTVDGPASSITIRDLRNGKHFTLNLADELTLGESVVIDTRPGRKSVTKSDGTDLFGDLTTASSFWPLWPGATAVRIELTGSDPGISQVLLTWLRLYLTV